MNPTQERRARQLLAEASIMPEAKAATFDQHVSHGKPQDHQPSGESWSLFDSIARRFANAHTDRALAEAIRYAEREIKAVRHTKPAPKIPFKLRILVEWEGHHYRAVERITRTAATTVRRWREEDGRDPLYGRKAA